MKPFFGKQVIEAPRRGSGASSVKVRHVGRFVHDEGELEYEGLRRIPTSRKAAKVYFRDCKDFSDKLGVLTHYLRSSCGRPWNDVYSEMKYELGRYSHQEGLRHILDAHLDVAVHTYRGIDGHIYYHGKYGVSPVGGPYWQRYMFHVEPETGILRESPRYRYPAKAPEPIEVIPISEGKEYRKIHNIWYYQEFHLIDVISDGIRGRRHVARTDKIVDRKRQLGKKQLKALKLK